MHKNRAGGKHKGLFWLVPLAVFLLALCLVLRFGIWSTEADAAVPGDEHQGMEGEGLGQNGENEEHLSSSSPVLAVTARADEEYLEGTLFLGDSNTERLYLGGYLPLQNMMGKTGIRVEEVPTVAFIRFREDDAYYTMPQAVAECAPRRVVTSFGSNDLPHLTTEEFIAHYRVLVGEIRQEYPYCDIVVNAVYPFGRENSYNLSLEKLMAYNAALAEMCREEGLVFLNSTEALATADGYARAGYTTPDGLHLTEQAMEAFLEYFMTHEHITEDRRPAVAAQRLRLQ